MPANPYALGRSGDYAYNVAADQPEYAAAQPEYSSPMDMDESENGYIDNPASAGAPRATSGHMGVYGLPVAGPSFTIHQTDGIGTREEMHDSAVDTPSSQRLELMPLMDRHNNTGAKGYFGPYGIEGTPSVQRSQRGGEDLQGNLFERNRGLNQGDRRWADNPRRDPVPLTRPTGLASPSMYRFYRPFDQLNRPYDDVVVGTARDLNGQHFSMADHRRTYDILGMAPQKTPRNTYRLEPTPWDDHMVDTPHPMTIR